MKTFALALILVACAGLARAELIISDQFVDLEVSAASGCPQQIPEPDFDKVFGDAVVGTRPAIFAWMASACGEASFDARLRVDRRDGRLDGTFEVRSRLDGHGGGRSSLTATITFQVDAPTPYTFACAGITQESGEPDLGGMEISLRGGAVDHSSELAEVFDLEWSGEFQPGVDYTVQLSAGAERSVRELQGQFLFMDGTTHRVAGFILTVGGNVVGSGSGSVSRVKGAW